MILLTNCFYSRAPCSWTLGCFLSSLFMFCLILFLNILVLFICFLGCPRGKGGEGGDFILPIVGGIFSLRVSLLFILVYLCSSHILCFGCRVTQKNRTKTVFMETLWIYSVHIFSAYELNLTNGGPRWSLHFRFNSAVYKCEYHLYMIKYN